MNLLNLFRAVQVEVSKIEFKSGDVLIVKVDTHLTADMAIRIREQLETLLPIGVKCGVLQKGMSVEIISTADPLDPIIPQPRGTA